MLKSTGIVRKVDCLGRVVLPMEIRKTYEISEDTPLEIFTDGEKIVIKKYKPGCIFCGQVDGVIKINGKSICPNCMDKIKEAAV
jgi:looped-hinge helix DNA binding domain, AbrB family